MTDHETDDAGQGDERWWANVDVRDGAPIVTKACRKFRCADCWVDEGECAHFCHPWATEV